MSITREMHIEGHKLLAQIYNPDAAGEPIILLHGIGLSINAWNTDTVFRAHGPCYSLSLPGHYPAVLPPDFCQRDLSAQMIARVLADAIRDLVADRPVTLVGNSTGGFAVLAVAAQSPEIARRIICISGFAHGQWTGNLGAMQWMARHGLLGRLLFRVMFKMLYSNRTLWQNAWSNFASDRRAFNAYAHLDALCDVAYHDARQLDLEAMLHYYTVMPDIDIGDWLPRITAPVLVLAGESDPIVPLAQSRLIAERAPRAELVVIKGAGHCAFAERTSEYEHTIDTWLRKYVA